MSLPPALPASITAGPFVPGQSVPSRYDGIPRLDYQGRILTAIRPRVPHTYRADDMFHIWADGEWLDLLAYKYYGDASLWWVIADFNEIPEVRTIEVGRQLRLPNRRRLLLEILTAGT